MDEDEVQSETFPMPCKYAKHLFGFYKGGATKSEFD